MKRRLFVVLAALVPAALAAQSSPAGLYQHQVEVRLPDRSGLVRLPLDASVVALAGPGLADLRIVDDRERELPFAVDATPREPTREIRTPIVVPLEAAQSTIPGPPALSLETYELELPTVPPLGAGWELDLAIAVPRFTATLEIAPRSGRGETIHRTVFRLRDGSARTRFPIPAELGPVIRVTLRGEEQPLSPSFSFVSTTRSEASVVLGVPLPRGEVRGDGTRTTVELVVPHGLVPSSLRVDSATATFSRHVSVSVRADGERWIEIGDGVAERRAGPAPLDARAIALVHAPGERMRVVLDDGASPPLESLALVALIEKPSLVFDPGDAAARGGSVRVLFGGRRAERPAYAEASMLGRLRGDALPETSHGPVEANPDASRSPALAFAMHAGAPVDVRAYRFRATLDVPASPEGLVRLPLPLGVVAAARDGLADLRLVDARHRQWAYVIVRGERPIPTRLAARRERSAPGTSVFRIELPREGIEVPAIGVDPRTPLVDRPIRVEDVSIAASPTLLFQGRLARRPGEDAPLELRLDAGRVRVLRVTIQDGDDAPLDPGFSLAFAQPTLYSALPEGRYALYVGAHDASPETRRPRYELEHARSLFMAVPSIDARLGRLRANPASEPPTPFSRERWRDVLLWVVLGCATILLFGLTLRLTRSESAQAEPEGPPPDADQSP